MQILTTGLAKYRLEIGLAAKARVRVRLLATAILLLVVFGAGLAWVQYGAAGLVGNDGYYHIKMGYLIRTQGLKPSFPYLPMTLLNAASFYDHHMLYHAYLAFFAGVDPALDGGLGLTEGAKAASIVMPAVAFLAVWWLLRSQQVPLAAVWSAGLLAVSEAFLYRMSMPRAQAASLLLLVLALHWLLQGRLKWLLPLGAVYVWTYNAFPLLMVVAAVYVAATWMLQRRFAWQALAYPAAGIFLGLVINPYFPANVDFISAHIAAKLGDSTTRVGNEWTPYRTWTLVENSGVALGAVLLGVLALGWREERIDLNTLVALGMTVVFGGMLLSSRRFVEYFPPFALVFCALSLAPLLRGWQEKWSRRPLAQVILAVAVLLMLSYSTFVTLSDARTLVARSKAPDHYANASLWLRSHAGSGVRVFQTDWDDFTRLFFYGGEEATYTVGLDPTFMELHDPDLFQEWVAITRGDVERPASVIRQRFGSDYVFSDLHHGDFLEKAEADAGLTEVYRDEYAIIFAVQ